MSATGAARLSLAYVIGTYPLLTTTFVDREIDVLRELGAEVSVVSLRRPHGTLSEDQQARMDEVAYVMPVPVLGLVAAHLRFLLSVPVRYLGAAFHVVSAPHDGLRLRFKTLLHFALAVRVASIVAESDSHHHVHAHFMDRAALVALVVGRLLGIPYSATAHANDIYVDPVLLPEKVREATFVATCTGANARHLERLVPGTGRVRTLHHGLDVDAYPVADRDSRGEPVLLAVGQLKEKKGFVHLVEACRLLADSGRPFRCEIVGEGPERARLEAAVAAAGLEGRVVLRGALGHDDVKAAYASADVFVLPCVVGADGDRDGIPNVILEAMASGLPVVSTDHSGIPEAVADGDSGLLVAPGDAAALSDAVGRLVDDADLRRRFGDAGRKHVIDAFDVRRNVGRLYQEFTS